MYKDKFIAISIPEQPATKGHARLTAAAATIESLSAEEFTHIISAATFTSSALFEQVGAQGTNIIFSDTDGVVVDVVARTEGDNLGLRWDPMSVPEDEMEQLTTKIKDKCDYIGVEQPKTSIAPQTRQQSTPQQQQEPEQSLTVENYLLKKLDRLP